MSLKTTTTKSGRVYPTAAVPPPSSAPPQSRSANTSNSKNTLQKPPSHTQTLNSQKTLAQNWGLVKSDAANIDDHENVELGNSIERIGPEKMIHVQDEGSVRPVIGPESGGDCVVRVRDGKKTIVRKVVRVVKKIVKKRVPKRVLKNDSENGVNLSDVIVTNVVDEAKEVVNKTDDVTESCNLVSDHVIEQSDKANEVEKLNIGTNVVDEAKEVVNKIDDVAESCNLVCDHVIEQSDNVNEVENLNIGNGGIGESNVVDEGKEIVNTTDDVNESCNLVSDHVIEQSDNVSEVMEKTEEEGVCGDDNLWLVDNDVSCIDSMETEPSKLDFDASFHEQLVLTDDQSGIITLDADNAKSNDVVTCVVPDSTEVEKVEEIADSVAENEAKDSVVENQNMYIVDETDVGQVGGKSVVNGSTCGESESVSAENDCVKLNDGLMMGGEMGALERKKKRKTEIFVGGLGNNTKEDDIRKVFEEVGVVVEVRLMMSNNTGKNRGYAFVRFATAYDAKNALAKYSKVEICGKECNVALVGGNDTLFLGNIDRNWKTDDVMTLLKRAGIEKIDKVTLKADPNNVEKNRGFAFLELETGKDAQTAFNKLQKKGVFGKNLMVKVEWAHPLIEPDEEELLKVKSVYAEYIPSSWDEEKVKEYFKRFGEIEDVVLAKDLPSSRRKDFAFIKYTNRSAALTCIEVVTRETSEDGRSKVKIDVSLANTNPKSKSMKRTPDLTSKPKQLPKAKPKAMRYFEKLHEPRHKGKPASNSYDDVKVDNRPSTTTHALVQILRQQASNQHILPLPHPHPRTGTNAPGVHFPLPGSKRPYSLVAHRPAYVEPHGLPRVRLESSYPIPGPSFSSRGVDVLSLHYPPQQRPGVTSESVIGRISYPSQYQERERAPYLRDNNLYHRY